MQTKQKQRLSNDVIPDQAMYSPDLIRITRTCNPKGGVHLQKESCLIFVLQGKFKFGLGNQTYAIQGGEWVFLAKNTMLEYSLDKGSPVDLITEYVCITLPRELVAEFAKMAVLPEVNSLEKQALKICPIDAGLQKYLEGIQTYIGHSHPVQAALLKIKLLELCFYLSMKYMQVLGLILDIRENYRADVSQAVEENILNSVSLSQLARMSKRSLSSFRRDFMAMYKMPPSQWIRQKRLAKARELLISTTMTVTDVCYSAGFESIAHFSRLFKAHFGCSPSEYRLVINPVS